MLFQFGQFKGHAVALILTHSHTFIQNLPSAYVITFPLNPIRFAISHITHAYVPKYSLQIPAHSICIHCGSYTCGKYFHCSPLSYDFFRCICYALPFVLADHAFEVTDFEDLSLPLSAAVEPLHCTTSHILPFHCIPPHLHSHY